MRYGINNKIVDLPGYGYAKVNVNTKKHWDIVLPYYLQKRKSLIGLIIVMDIRHALTKLDEQMIEWFLPTQKPIHILLTKADKLSRNQAQKEVNKFTKKIEACNFNGNITYQTFSSLKKTGLDDVEEIFLEWLPSLG
jgi:GTP-binding protein